MTFDELITQTREDYLDDVADNPDQGDEWYRWPHAFLRRALEDAERQACRRTDLIFDNTTAAVCQITLADGTSTYSLHEKITRIKRVIYADNPLNHKSEDELNASDGQWRTRSGTPTAYIVQGRSIRLTPIPDSDDDAATLYLEVWRLPLTTFATSPEIPSEWHEPLCLYAAYRAFRRRDEDTMDMPKAQDFLREFNVVFGRPVDSLIREHQLRSPASLKMRFSSGYADTQRSLSED